MHKILSVLLIIFSCFIISFTPAKAADKIPDSQTVVVEGEAAILGSDGVAADAAVASAKRTAVEQVTGVYILSETKVKNFQTLSDEIYTKSEGYVSEYEIVEKQKRKDTVWVKIKAKVSLEPLVDSLKKLGLLRKWTIAVVIGSTSSSDKSNSEFSDSAVTALNEIILESGFRVVDQDVMASLEKPEVFTQILAGNYLAASKILKDNGVDILIAGKAFSEEVAGNNFDAYGVNVYLSSSKGRLEGKLVRADTGELLATKTFEGVGLGSGKDTRSQALKNSGVEAGKYFVNQIMKLPAATSNYIQLTVKGLSFSRAKEFIETLKSVRGVRKVINRGFRNKEALYEVEAEGDVNLLADNMAENKKLTQTFKFDITTVSSGKIEASGN